LARYKRVNDLDERVKAFEEMELRKLDVERFLKVGSK
jgi:hypothetical protein